MFQCFAQHPEREKNVTRHEQLPVLALTNQSSVGSVKCPSWCGWHDMMRLRGIGLRMRIFV